jgi:putative oxidoreductase
MQFPFLSPSQSLWLLRATVALLIMAHAVMRIINGTVPSFGSFLESQGLPNGQLWVWAITATELVAGALLLAGRYVRWAAAALFFILAVGIVLIHRHLGWWVGEHGTGGSEYTVALMAMLVAAAATDRGSASRP